MISREEYHIGYVLTRRSNSLRRQFEAAWLAAWWLVTTEHTIGRELSGCVGGLANETRT